MRAAGSTCRLNRDKVVQVVRLAGGKQFVEVFKKFIA